VVGATLGNLVGTLVELVGFAVVGTTVGGLLGAIVGAFVGGLLGAREGLTVGDCEIVGLVDGLIVDGLADEGLEVEGFTVGLRDGDFVGIAVGCDAVIVTANDSEGIPFAITSSNPFPLAWFIGTVK